MTFWGRSWYYLYLYRWGNWGKERLRNSPRWWAGAISYGVSKRVLGPLLFTKTSWCGISRGDRYIKGQGPRFFYTPWKSNIYINPSQSSAEFVSSISFFFSVMLFVSAAWFLKVKDELSKGRINWKGSQDITSNLLFKIQTLKLEEGEWLLAELCNGRVLFRP